MSLWIDDKWDRRRRSGGEKQNRDPNSPTNANKMRPGIYIFINLWAGAALGRSLVAGCGVQ